MKICHVLFFFFFFLIVFVFTSVYLFFFLFLVLSKCYVENTFFENTMIRFCIDSFFFL
jgi:hypothetical protein